MTSMSDQERPPLLKIRIPRDLHADLKQRAQIEDLPLNRVVVRMLRKGMREWKPHDNSDVE